VGGRQLGLQLLGRSWVRRSLIGRAIGGRVRGLTGSSFDVFLLGRWKLEESGHIDDRCC
jgi:hypothetical protein